MVLFLALSEGKHTPKLSLAAQRTWAGQRQIHLILEDICAETPSVDKICTPLMDRETVIFVN